MWYPGADATFAASDAKIELAQALFARVEPVAGTPAETYLLQTRRLPAAAVRACADLRYLPPPIEGRPPQDHALVSLLRDSDGEISGFQLEFVVITGARTGEQPNKQSYALRASGVRDGLFHAGGSGDVAYLCEGYSAKPLAVASLGLGRVYGAGGLNVLGFAVPPERTVVIVPDRAPAPDKWTEDGKERLLDQHEAAYARATDRLLLAGCTVLVATAPDCAVHAACKDADAFLKQHGELRLKELLLRTVPGELSRDGEIKRLAGIAGELDRAAAIKAAWKDKGVLHGIPVAMLREHVAAERAKTHASTEPKPDTAEPWDEPVELGAILNELVAELGRYIATPRTNLYTAALWVAMTHVYDRLYCAPKLALQSPTPGAGKTTFLDCLANVVRRPEPVSGVSASAFIRMSDAFQPCWLLDEADRSLNPKNASEELTAAINASSYRRMARIIISVPLPGGGWEQQAFTFWCPMILSGIKRLVDTVQDRSIVLVMQRARPGELKHRLINGTSQRFQDIQRKLIRWASDLAELDLDPPIPSFLHNREADLWRPCFALAALAGGRWPRRVEAAARVIHGQRSEESARLVELLEAIRDCFGEEQQLATSDLVTRLINRVDEPWAAIKRGQPIDAYYLRTMLHGIVKRQKPKQRVGKDFWRGYLRSDFAEAWARYLPSDPVHPSATSATPPHTAGKPQPEPASERGGSVADDPRDMPHRQHIEIAGENGAVAGVAHVADENGGFGTYVTCAACGTPFSPDITKHGRRPTKCPGCRGGGSQNRAHHAAPPRAATADEVVDPVRAGQRCAHCSMPFLPGDEPVEIDGKVYHSDDACAGMIRRRLAAQRAAT